MKDWLKGGLIGGIVGIAFDGIYMLMNALSSNSHDLFQYLTSIGWLPSILLISFGSFINLFNHTLYRQTIQIIMDNILITNLASSILIGLIIGLIIGKIKQKKENQISSQ